MLCPYFFRVLDTLTIRILMTLLMIILNILITVLVLIIIIIIIAVPFDLLLVKYCKTYSFRSHKTRTPNILQFDLTNDGGAHERSRGTGCTHERCVDSTDECRQWHSNV